MFGSFIRNKQKKDSDIDIIIISKDWEKINFSKRLEELYKIWDYPYDVTILPYTPNEIENMKKKFTYIQEIFEYAIEVKLEET